ncbi:hypothetical protein [Chitinophaga deserti]|uniref:hypothetical protein n=1 Tax=Chitinophaga deserti TaxID=2164099 RepID=UPI000D6D5C8C|nr:hypothetical protein [Chitinophaga deserti]
MKKLLSGIILLCVVVTGLFVMLISGSDKPAHARTAVNRIYKLITATPADTQSIAGETHHLATFEGITYAFDQKAGALFRITPQEGSRQIISNLRNHFQDMPASLQIDSSGIYFFSPNQKKVFRYSLDGGQPDLLPTGQLPYTRAARLADSLYFIHMYDTATQKAHFKLADFRNGGRLISNLYDFPHTDDGGLASDGQITTAGNQLPAAFLQYHNSEVLLWDTSGFRTFQTIDRTPATNTIIKSGNSWSISSKTIFINLEAAIDSQYLYVLSNAASGNEATITPEIDVYNLASGAYSGSLKLPPYGGAQVRHIAVDNGILYTSHKQHIIAYKLNYP